MSREKCGSLLRICKRSSGANIGRRRSKAPRRTLCIRRGVRKCVSYNSALSTTQSVQGGTGRASSRHAFDARRIGRTVLHGSDAIRAGRKRTVLQGTHAFDARRIGRTMLHGSDAIRAGRKRTVRNVIGRCRHRGCSWEHAGSRCCIPRKCQREEKSNRKASDTLPETLSHSNVLLFLLSWQPASGRRRKTSQIPLPPINLRRRPYGYLLS
jgi:hypothetical protein